jgi:broad specificity phosphatase PhoE
MKKVFFHGMRHGTKFGDALSVFGLKQVVASTLAFLVQIPLRRFYSSMMQRTKQTAEAVATFLGYAGVTVIQNECFGFTGEVDGQKLDWTTLTPQDIEVMRATQSVRELAQKTPLVKLVAKRLFAGMLDIISEMEAGDMCVEEIHIFFASHGPTVETAVIETTDLDLPAAHEADVITYAFEKQDKGVWQLVNATLQRCPLTEDTEK